jgi:hypothetical protein
VLNFQDLSENISEKINSRIFQLSLNIFHSDLSTKVLNKAVFKQLRVLDISGEINSIQNDLFESFQHLKLLRFRVQNVKGIRISIINYDFISNCLVLRIVFKKK